MKNKHAYLIMVHNNFYCLEKLLLLLDDSRNDIFIHVDKKVKNFNFHYYKQLCSKGNVIFTPQRINVQWGTQSQINTELLLFEYAVSCNQYMYYHLLSGSDLPLKSQKWIHDFFYNRTECFMTVHDEFSIYDYQRISRYHGIFGKKMPWSNRLNAYASIIQEKMGVDRIAHWKNLLLKRGWNWVSIPHSAVILILSQRNWIKKFTRFSVCADEMYKQIILLNSAEKIFQENNIYSSLRYIDWENGANNHPHVFTINDYQRLINSDMLFARKFDENIDRNIIDMIYDYVRKQEES